MEEGKYMYRVNYNHEVVHKEENKNPIEVSNVNVFTTKGIPVDGWVRNLVYAGKTEILSATAEQFLLEFSDHLL